MIATGAPRERKRAEYRRFTVLSETVRGSLAERESSNASDCRAGLSRVLIAITLLLYRLRGVRSGGAPLWTPFASVIEPSVESLASPRRAPRATEPRCVGRAMKPRSLPDRPQAPAPRRWLRLRRASACWHCGRRPSCRHCTARADPEYDRGRTPSPMARSTPRSARCQGSSPDKSIPDYALSSAAEAWYETGTYGLFLRV
jgi:hypothetical protein